MMDVFTQFIKNPIPYEWEAGTKKQDRKAGKRDDIGKILRYMGKKRMAGVYLRRSDFRKYQLWGTHLKLALINGVNFANAYPLIQGIVNEYILLKGLDPPILPTGINPLTQNRPPMMI